MSIPDVKSCKIALYRTFKVGSVELSGYFIIKKKLGMCSGINVVKRAETMGYIAINQFYTEQVVEF